MKIRLEENVVIYIKKNNMKGIVVENTPVGSSCIGIHLHAQPEYALDLNKYEKDETFEMFLSDEDTKIFIEKVLLPLEEIHIFGKDNPFNQKVYLYCVIKKM